VGSKYRYGTPVTEYYMAQEDVFCVEISTLAIDVVLCCDDAYADKCLEEKTQDTVMLR
jgi:hypothetical protein